MQINYYKCKFKYLHLSKIIKTIVLNHNLHWSFEGRSRLGTQVSVVPQGDPGAWEHAAAFWNQAASARGHFRGKVAGSKNNEWPYVPCLHSLFNTGLLRCQHLVILSVTKWGVGYLMQSDWKGKIVPSPPAPYPFFCLHIAFHSLSSHRSGEEQRKRPCFWGPHLCVAGLRREGSTCYCDTELRRGQDSSCST